MTRSLDRGERELLTLVSRAAFENPFSAERDRLDEKIAHTRATDPEVLPRLVERVGDGLRGLAGGERLSLADFAGDDRELVEHAILFDVFHRTIGALDAHIGDQLAAGSEPIAAPFARGVLSELTRHGVEEARAIRMLMLFFQMRRAFFFIARGLVGRSRVMRRLREALWSSVFTHDIRLYDRFLWDRMEDFSTILLGETGTGKGAAAAAIGRSGFIPFDPKKERFAFSFTDSFVPINLSQFPESLIESELFGHRKGAFTGAIENREGVFDRCRQHGAIFLDEIGEVSIPVQIKLLRVLQERLYAPVGGHVEKKFEGRVIAATHRPLDELRKEGRFRDDFYYRLSSDVIQVPPLRARLAEEPGELDDLVESLIPRLIGAPSPELQATVRQAALRDLGPSYGWPGNVRELEQCIRRVMLTRSCAPDARADADASTGLAALFTAGTLTAEELIAKYCTLLHARHGTYVEVARITGLDRRTVKKYVEGDAS
jgi:DNA-binding NtrC family response regulator